MVPLCSSSERAAYEYTEKRKAQFGSYLETFYDISDELVLLCPPDQRKCILKPVANTDRIKERHNITHLLIKALFAACS